VVWSMGVVCETGAWIMCLVCEMFVRCGESETCVWIMCLVCEMCVRCGETYVWIMCLVCEMCVCGVDYRNRTKKTPPWDVLFHPR